MPAPMTQAAIKDSLRGIPLFADLSAEELEVLAPTIRSVAARKNARVFEQGAPADCCFVLTSGLARVMFGGWSDTEIVFSTVRPRDLVGEIALFNRSTRSASLVAVENCHFLRISSTSFDTLRKNPRFEDKVVAHIISTLMESNHARAILLKPIMTRVAGCLARIARQEGQRDGAIIVIPRKKHQELADVIGCSRETVSRKLETLRRKRCVSWDGNTMRLDIERIQQYLRADLRVP